MEEDGIELVLGRATDLRLKISNCINKATAAAAAPEQNGGGDSGGEVKGKEEGGDDGDDEETLKLLNISDALESLESQLSNLQALQQQQRYEREAALAEIDYSRKVLLNKLKEYKGKDLEVIHEASVFAGETVEHNNDLMLPPYPSRPPHSLVLDDGYQSQFPSIRKSIRNGVISRDPLNQTKKNLSDSKKDQSEAGSKSSSTGWGLFINVVAKTMLTFGVLSVLSLTGISPRLRIKDNPIKILGMVRQPASEEKRLTDQCPPGKILVVEDGVARCLVKERVEVPFGSVIAAPDLNYGCG